MYTLEDLDLSGCNLIKPQNSLRTDHTEDEEALDKLLTQIVTSNRKLEHLNLARCNLPKSSLLALFKCIQVSPSLQAVHLSDNPGCCDAEVRQTVHTQFGNKDVDIEQDTSLSTLDLILFRILGQKRAIPGSEVWRLADDQSCWICDKWNYTVIYWTRN